MEGDDTEDAGVDAAEGEEEGEGGGGSGLFFLAIPEEITSSFDWTLAHRWSLFGWYQTGEADE